MCKVPEIGARTHRAGRLHQEREDGERLRRTRPSDQFCTNGFATVRTFPSVSVVSIFNPVQHSLFCILLLKKTLNGCAFGECFAVSFLQISEAQDGAWLSAVGGKTCASLLTAVWAAATRVVDFKV